MGRPFEVGQFAKNWFRKMELVKRDFRAMIYLHYRQEKLAVDSHQILYDVFSDQAPSRATVQRWFADFKRGRTSLEDENRSGRPADAVTPETIAAVRDLIKTERNSTYQQIQEALGIGSSSVNTILHDHLHVRKLVSRWVPRGLSEEQKKERVRWCRFMLKKFDGGESKSVWDILTGDETWIYQYDPETKQQSTVWVFEGEDPPTKFKRSRSVNKKMVASFFMKTGHLASVPLEDRRTVNSEWYTTVCLPEIFEEVCAKRPVRRTRGLLLHHDNASAHTSAQTLDFLAQENVQLVSHPPYSPDLAPCDFFLFPKVKEKLRGIRFVNANAAVDAYIDVIKGMGDYEWRLCFQKWFDRMKSCIESQGKYFEHV